MFSFLKETKESLEERLIKVTARIEAIEETSNAYDRIPTSIYHSLIAHRTERNILLKKLEKTND